MRPKLFVFVLVFFTAVPAWVAGQLFPFDRRHDGSCITADSLLIVTRIDEHLKFFGKDSLTLEIYFDEMTQVPAPPGWAYTLRCVETFFVEKKRVAGPLLFPLCRGRKYTFLFYRDGCCLELTAMQELNGITSISIRHFGRCPPPVFKKT